MTAIEGQKPKPFWERHLGTLIVGGFAVLLGVIVLLQVLVPMDAVGKRTAVDEQPRGGD